MVSRVNEVQPQIIASSLLRLPAFLDRHSIEPLEFFSRVGIQPNIFLQAGGWLPRELCFRVAEEAARMSGDQFVGARVGAAIRLADLGEFGQRVASAPTLGQALKIAEIGSSQLHRGSLYKIETQARDVAFRFEFLGASEFEPEHYVTGTIAFLRNIALLGNVPEGVSVRLKTPRFFGGDKLEEFLGGRLEFGARDDAVVVNRELLDLPLQKTSLCAMEIDKLPYPVVVARLLVDNLREGGGSLREVARALHCSERTVERNIGEYGITFERMLDRIRHDEAIRLVREKKLTLMEIALELGYSDHANFTRAFRRWTGVAPSRFPQSSD